LLPSLSNHHHHLNPICCWYDFGFACDLQEQINYVMIGNYPSMTYFQVNTTTGAVRMETSLLQDNLLLERYEVCTRWSTHTNQIKSRIIGYKYSYILWMA
jgi:hypothetical protein